MTKIDSETIAEIRAMRAGSPVPTWASLGRRFGITGQAARYWCATERERRKLAHPRGRRTAKDGHCGRVDETPVVLPALTPHASVDAIVTGLPEIERSALWERLTESERAELRARTISRDSNYAARKESRKHG